MERHLAICIVSWNTRKLLRQCLESVFANLDGLDAEVIVVDNASEDSSAEMVEREFPDVTLIRSESNRGFASANNLGLSRSSSKYFLLLNSDTIVLPGALRSLVEFMDAAPEAGAVAPKLLNLDGSLQRSCSSFPSPLTELLDAVYLSKVFPRSRLFGRFAMSYWDFDAAREVDFAGGSCLLLRRFALEQVGPLDESYFMYTEEADLCFRLKRAGWKVVFVPHARIIHIGGQSSKRRPVEMAVELPVSRHRFIAKFEGPVRAALFKGAVALGGVCRLAVWGPWWLAANGRRSDVEQRLRTQSALLKWALGGGRR
ncbi:MAG: glycosyltransferase family 2 protein [Armatimonadota bacterium]|nr:glycosyltransferase family 2 protein [Armatimonadota bacterium]